MNFKKLLILLAVILIGGALISGQDNRYNENLNTPQDMSGGGTISAQTGEISLSGTDISLPGLNGLNFEANRTYSSTLANIYNMKTDASARSLVTVHTPADWKYGIGAGWTFGWPFIIRDIDDKTAIQKMNLFWGGSVFEIDQTFSTDKDATNLKYYYVTDKRIYRDTSVKYTNDVTDPLLGPLSNYDVSSAYCLELKNGTKYYFSEAGNLMCIKNPSDPGDLKTAEIWFYYKAHTVTTNPDEYLANRANAKIEMIVDSLGRQIDFIYKTGSENWLEEINYKVTIMGEEKTRRVKYYHKNINEYQVYAINDTDKTLDLLTTLIPASDNKFTLSGFQNQMETINNDTATRYDYRVYEAQFSYYPSQNKNYNYFANITKIYSNYSNESSVEKYKNAVCFDYNRLKESYVKYKKKFAAGYMEILKGTEQYMLSKRNQEKNIESEVFNKVNYEFYGNNYSQNSGEYWTLQTTGNVTKQYTYGLSNLKETDNMLLSESTSANAEKFKELIEYTYAPDNKTLKTKKLSRSGIVKYTEEFTYDKHNDLIIHTAPNGLVTETQYDPKFHIPTKQVQKDIVNGDGSKFDTDARNEIRQTDGKVLSKTVYATVNGTRKAIKAEKITYDGYGNPSIVEDVLGNKIYTYYDTTYNIFPEKVEMEVTLNGVKTTVKGFKLFDTDGKVWIECDNDGYSIEHIYDDLGTEIKTIMPDENDDRDITNAGDLADVSRTDNGYVEMTVDYQDESVITYGEIYNGTRVKSGKFANGLGMVLKEVLYENETSNVEYSVKEMEYDAFGNMIALTDPDAGEAFVKTEVMNKLVKVHDKTWLVSYDDLNRKIKVIYPDDSGKEVVKTVEYNDVDLTVTTTNTNKAKTIEYYDVAGNLIKITRPQVKDYTGAVKDLTYTFQYNKLKQKTAFTDPAGEKVTYSFDERGLLKKQDFGNGADLMSYDLRGKMLSKTDRNENLINFVHDEMGRNTEQYYFKKGEGLPYDSIRLGYDGRGNLTKVYGKRLEETMTYDSRARLLDVERVYRDAALRHELDAKLDWVTTDTTDDVTGQKFRFEFKYTPNNLVDTVKYPNGKVFQYSYDETKLRLSGIKADVKTESGVVLSDIVTGLEYNKGGQVTALSYANNTTQYWEFDRRKRIKKIEVESNSSNILKLEYKIDTEGNILKINDNEFAYDEMNRIIKSDILRLGEIDKRLLVKDAFGTTSTEEIVEGRIFNKEADLNDDDIINADDHIKTCFDYRDDRYDREAFTYDHNGNRRELIQNGKTYKYEYGTRKRLLKITRDNNLVVEYKYDNNGNTTERAEYGENGAVSAIYTFEYDINNRLTTVKKNGTIHAEYIYDNAGMRMYKWENGKRTYYFRNGGSVNYEVEIDDAKTEVNEHSYIMSGELIAGRMTRKNLGNDEVTYYHLDHLNSTKMVTDKDAAVIIKYEYRAFGSQLNRIDGQGNDTDDKARFSYIGREFDEEINLYYLNARYYDATIGRFINVDPIQDGTNWYVYCNNNPLSFKDPTGLSGIGFWTGMISIAAGITTAGIDIAVAGGVITPVGWVGLGIAAVGLVATGIGMAADYYSTKDTEKMNKEIQNLKSRDELNSQKDKLYKAKDGINNELSKIAENSNKAKTDFLNQYRDSQRTMMKILDNKMSDNEINNILDDNIKNNGDKIFKDYKDNLEKGSKNIDKSIGKVNEKLDTLKNEKN